MWPYSISPDRKIKACIFGVWKEISWKEVKRLYKTSPKNKVIELAYSYLETYRQEKTDAFDD